ncbi:MAG: hypothetical protein HRF50_10320 [Phycisphaerae bacterium]|jgi:hypothetical protein
MRFNRTTLALVLAGALAAAAQAQHEGDVEFAPVGGTLLVAPNAANGYYVFEGGLGENPLLPPNVIDEPGFESALGAFDPGDQVSFNVMANLLYWDGAQFANAPMDHEVEMQKAIFSTVVGADTGAQSGFVFGEADVDGDIHEHMDFILHGPGEPDALTPGAYGLWLQLASPQYAPSNEFIILLNHGLSAAEYEAGVEAAAALVPEPSTIMLWCAACVPVLLRRR